MKALSLIVAMTRDRVIGCDNRLPWHLPEDLKRFKRLTMGHPIIMGRKTYESIGKPLPGRQNIVVSRDRALRIPGVEIAHSLPEALALCPASTTEAFVIGGSSLFAEAWPTAQRIYLTWVEQNFAGDVYFPTADFSAYRVTSDEAGSGAIPHRFVTYERTR